MSTGQAMQRAEGLAIARHFAELIDPYVERGALAGSIRRGATGIHDIELVVVPRIETVEAPNLFGEMTTTGTVDLLDAHLTMLLDRGVVQRRLRADGRAVWGESMKFLIYQGASIDLFSPCAERFGWILLLRTGPQEFSRQLVVERGRKTKDGRAGLLPNTVRPVDGWLTHRVSGQRIETREEADAFRALGLRYRSPEERR